MMGPRQVSQGQLFYEFPLETMVPSDHLLRAMDRFVDLSCVRSLLAPTYSSTGRPSVDPELMIRMLLVGYCYGIRSERRLCEEVGLNLAYRWFCRLDLTDAVPDHSTFSKNRHGRFRDCDLLRQVFEAVLTRCNRRPRWRQAVRGGRFSDQGRRQPLQQGPGRRLGRGRHCHPSHTRVSGHS